MTEHHIDGGAATVITGLHHVGLLVADIDAAIRFYADVLGLDQRDRPDVGVRGAWFDVGAGELHVFEGATPADGGQHVALSVADIDVMIARLQRCAVDFKTYPRNAPPRQVVVHDPSGNRVELTFS